MAEYYNGFRINYLRLSKRVKAISVKYRKKNKETNMK